MKKVEYFLHKTENKYICIDHKEKISFLVLIDNKEKKIVLSYNYMTSYEAYKTLEKLYVKQTSIPWKKKINVG